MAALLLLACLLQVASASAFTCKSALDCEANGACAGGACACFRGWRGPSCGTLDLAPASFPAAQAWPLPVARNASSWGFTKAYDSASGLFHALVTVACGASGVIGQGGGQSWIAHITSSSGVDGWALAPRHGMFALQTTFGPHLSQAADGTFVAVVRVNTLLNSTLCSGNSSGAEPSALVEDSSIPPHVLVSGDPEAGTSIYIASAATMAGPWTAKNVSILGGGGVHKSNPSLTQLRDGRWAMAYRNNPGKGERLALALAEAASGPYTDVRNITECPAGPGDKSNNCEDPFIWQDSSNSSLAHILFHNGPFGLHTAGSLDGKEGWAASPTGAAAYTLDVQTSAGSTFKLLRRERPELQLRPDGTPAVLITGATAMDGATLRAFSLLQDIK